MSNIPHSMFAVAKGDIEGSFALRAEKAFANLEAENGNRRQNGETLVWIRVFLSDVINQLPQIKHTLDNIAEGCAVSIVEQPPLDDTKITIMACYLKDSAVERVSPNCWNINVGNDRFVYQSLRFKDEEVKGVNGHDQTVKAFEIHKKLLAERGMTIKDNTLRTWFFCRDIDHTYAGVVKGRNDFFAQNGLTSSTHFIASTGIGGYTESPNAIVGVGFLSREGGNADVKYLQAPDYLNPTAQYGVAFERGTAFSAGDCRVSLISGTASIDKHGKCIYLNDAAKQTERLIENTEALLNDDGATADDIKMMIFYLRDAADKYSVMKVAEKLLPDVPMVFTHAKVCRPGWLVEAESIAVKKTTGK